MPRDTACEHTGTCLLRVRGDKLQASWAAPPWLRRPPFRWDEDRRFLIRTERGQTLLRSAQPQVASERLGRKERIQLDTITTTLKREWFAKIVDGSKRVEYREIKPYWTKRLAAVKTPFVLVLRNGMTPPVPVVTVRIDRVVPSPRGRVRKGKYELHIGRVLKVEHWDRKARCPK